MKKAWNFKNFNVNKTILRNLALFVCVYIFAAAAYSTIFNTLPKAIVLPEIEINNLKKPFFRKIPSSLSENLPICEKSLNRSMQNNSDDSRRIMHVWFCFTNRGGLCSLFTSPVFASTNAIRH